MKKILLMAAFAVASLSANAQAWIGGGIGFDFENHKDEATVTSFTLAPEVGYTLSDKWAIGLQFDLGYASTNPEHGDSFGTTTLTLAPYARYTFAKAGIASFFVDGGFGIGVVKVEDADAATVWHVGFRPGVAFNITDHVSFVGTTGYFGFRHADDYSHFGLNVNNTIGQVGFYYTF
ncbi:MAG: porin family protein [Bacteroidaceae bacterium]|nr:porin family protein [Bacteroidaceae bacterium]